MTIQIKNCSLGKDLYTVMIDGNTVAEVISIEELDDISVADLIELYKEMEME